MAHPAPTKKDSPTKADYRTVDPFHAFAVIGQSIRELLVKLNILHPKPARHAAKTTKKEKRRH